MTRTITIEDLYQFKTLSKPRMSPDGQRVAFVVTTIDERLHTYRSAIWVIPAGSGEAQRFTNSVANAHSPAWSPDGRWLAFVSDRQGEALGKDATREQKASQGKPQIWLMPANGGEARQLTRMPHGANQPQWSPDSQRILFGAAVAPLDEESEDGKPLPKVRVIDRLFYRLDGVGFIHDRRQHLFLIDVTGGEVRQITGGDWDDRDAAWSPGGERIAFVSSRGEDRWHLPCFDIYTLGIENGQSGELRRHTDGTLSCSSPSWSPDGQTIAFLGALRLRSVSHNELYTIDADAQHAAALALSHEFEGSCGDWTNSDTTDEQLMPAPAWSRDGKTLYVLASQRGASRVYAISSEGAGKQPPTLTPGGVDALDFSLDSSRGTLLMLIEDPTRVAEIFVCSLNTPGALRRLTSFNDDLFNELRLTTPEHITYAGADGWPVDGWIIKPPDFDSTRKYPLIVEIHGGPNTQYGYGFIHEMHVLAASGYVVLYTNPRGSIGYGHDFALAVRGAWAEKDPEDIVNGIDAVIQKGYIDEQRLGVIGGSYGGFMTNWLISHSDRFKAAVTDRSVADRASFFGSSDIGWKFAADDLESTPYEEPERHRRMSPLTYVQDIHTPLLIIHSESDARCNIEQAEQLFAALKYMGREVLFVRFEGQSHGLSRGGHPHSRLERLRHIRAWFEKYL
ncbi:MAG TPA: S9 family peptidase [Ktedonobacteraceae bacterium]|nr:S9 family peptidase [Ktedonobacteraceae bacterium]